MNSEFETINSSYFTKYFIESNFPRFIVSYLQIPGAIISFQACGSLNVFVNKIINHCIDKFMHLFFPFSIVLSSAWCLLVDALKK